MSTVYHTDIASSDALTVQGVNAPLEELDAAIGALQASGTVTDTLLAIISDSKATTTAGGSASATTYNQRALNAESDPDSIVVIGSDRFTPIAGVYYLFAYAPALDVRDHKLRLVNYTQAASTVAHGQNAYANDGVNMPSTAYLMHIFEANGTDAYYLDHYTETASATNGLGDDTSDGGAEIYAQGILIKLPEIV